MSNYLELIVERKKIEIAALKKKKKLRENLRGDSLKVIAEIKRRSPSKGMIREIADPLQLAKAYLEGGASALSVLTDKEGFGGSLEDLQKTASTFPDACVLRKDFIIDPIQLEETCKAGASAVLLIVAILGNKTSLFIEEAKKWHLETLVEVHNEEELAIAIAAGSEIIGVNNRNLSTFEIDLSVAERLAPLIPQGIVKVAESGISSREDALRMRKAGYDAVLVGEALVKAHSPQELIKKLSVCHEN